MVPVTEMSDPAACDAAPAPDVQGDVLDLPAPSASDIYLSPHSDDICFSLGALAKARAQGILLTVFPVSGCTAATHLDKASKTGKVTEMRMAEDAEFARHCKLTPGYLDFDDGPTAGFRAFDPAGRSAVARRVEASLIRCLHSRRREAPPNPTRHSGFFTRQIDTSVRDSSPWLRSANGFAHCRLSDCARTANHPDAL